MNHIIKVGIIGASGYIGVELIRILSAHPNANIVLIASSRREGQYIQDIFANLRGHCELRFEDIEKADFSQCDVVFSAAPNGIAMKYAKSVIKANAYFIDLSADFRIKDVTIWEKWYSKKHTAAELLDEAAYGLPELNRENIRKAKLIACPGCYPTATQLAIAPLIKHNKVQSRIVIDAKSGISGAGRGESVNNLLAEASESIKPYSAQGHRHLPEIEQQLNLLSNERLSITFMPHLIPMIRGILVSCYLQTKGKVENVNELFKQFYESEPFVDILSEGVHPETRSVKGSNVCRISIFNPQDSDTLAVFAVEDNLVKGAAGQAVQCMNLCFNLPETQGLNSIALLP